MSVNRFKPHIYLIPEDDADRELAIGFLDCEAVRKRVVDPLPPAGGWPGVLSRFTEVYVPKLRESALTHVVMLIDFDDQYGDRWDRFQRAIPPEVAPRTFVIGPLVTPETLQRETDGRKREVIGRALAEACLKSEPGLWDHPHLAHNRPELHRMMAALKPFVFQSG